MGDSSGQRGDGGMRVEKGEAVDEWRLFTVLGARGVFSGDLQRWGGVVQIE